MSNEAQAPKPSSDQEWRVHALNIQGPFLERWVEDTIRRTEHWGVVATNFPVAFEGATEVQEGEIDVLAEREGKQLRLTVPVECKKNNPEFIEWVFLEKPYRQQITAVRHTRVDTAEPGSFLIQRSRVRLNFDAPMTSEAREVRGSYLSYKGGEKTRTANDAIRAAARQVALGNQALVQADLRTAARGGQGARMDARIFIPMIVTTARLSSAKLDPALVSAESGELPLGALDFQPRTHLAYEYPLPRHLQFPDVSIVDSSGEILDDGTRLEILVVHSSDLPGLLGQVTEDIQMRIFVRE